MEVLSNEAGEVGILLTKDEAIILKHLLQIDHKKGREFVEKDTNYSARDAEVVENRLWMKLNTIFG